MSTRHHACNHRMLLDTECTTGRCDDGTMAVGRVEVRSDQGGAAIRGGGAAAGGDGAAQPAPPLWDGHVPGGGDRLAGVCVAHAAGARVVLLPALPYGTETNQMRFPMAMNLNPSTVARVIADLVDSLEAHGDRPLPDPEWPRGQRPEVGAARAAPIVESSPLPVQLV